MNDKNLVQQLAETIIPELLGNKELISKIDSLSHDKFAEIISRDIVKEVVIKINAKDVQSAGRQHQKFPDLIKVMSSRLPSYIVGPAGSGKTVAVESAAIALKLSFGAMSVGPMTTQTHIFGYMDAQGKYVPTEFRDRYEQGGVFLFDEIDAGNPQVLTSINSAIAQNQCSFPDGMVKKHPDFVCVASGNTWGFGGSVEYVGRNAMDAATLDRFVFIEWPYDEQFEMLISGNSDWTKKIQKLRAKVTDKKVRVVISPRASIYGCKLLDQGFTQEEVLKMVVFKGMDEATMKKIQEKN